MKKLAFAAATLAVASALLSTSAFASDSTGSLAGGSNLYKVRNVTTKTQFSTDASATCNETIRYSIELSNTDYSSISNITVKAPLTGAITVNGTDADGSATQSTGQVNVKVDKGTLTYDQGSSELYDVNGNLMRKLDDTVTTTGVNAGALAGSTREYVQFTATVKCDTTPTTPVTPATPATQTTPATPSAPATPSTPALPSTGAGDMVLPALGLATVAATAVYFVNSRRARA